MLRTALALSLTPLFASLLSGCFGCDPDYKRMVMLSADEYAELAYPQMSSPTSGITTTGDTGTGGDDTSTGDGGTTEMATADEICTNVCIARFEDVVGCSISDQDEAGGVIVTCEISPFCGGRTHACIFSQAHTDDSAAAWLARAAHDEAASVHAFEALAAELTAHHAPASLISRIQAAAADETRHAATLARLAHDHGATPIPVATIPTPARTLLAIALENAREGCVHETWAALSAAHQAQHATTPRLRSIFKNIAADEARHAELAWSLDTWLSGQLTANQRTLVEATRTAAATHLRTFLAAQPFSPALAALGLPSPAAATRLAAGLTAALWSQAA